MSEQTPASHEELLSESAMAALERVNELEPALAACMERCRKLTAKVIDRQGADVPVDAALDLHRLRELGLREALIQGVDPECARVYAQGWAQATRGAQARLEELDQQNYWLTRERDSAKAAVQPLVDANQMWHERIRRIREMAKAAKAVWANRCICPGDAEEHDADCLGVQTVGWALDPQALLATLAGEGEKADV
jgi:hypothetical protein